MSTLTVSPEGFSFPFGFSAWEGVRQGWEWRLLAFQILKFWNISLQGRKYERWVSLFSLWHQFLESWILNFWEVASSWHTIMAKALISGALYSRQIQLLTNVTIITEPGGHWSSVVEHWALEGITGPVRCSVSAHCHPARDLSVTRQQLPVTSIETLLSLESEFWIFFRLMKLSTWEGPKPENPTKACALK